MDFDQRIALAAKLIPQVDAAVRMGMDKQVLDRMLQDSLDVSELPGQPTMTLPQAFEQLEKVHGGFRDFYQTVGDTMRRERVQADVLRIQAIFSDIEDSAALHFMSDLRRLCATEPTVAARMKDLSESVKELRENVTHCKNLGKDLTDAVNKIEASSYVSEAETQSYVRRSAFKMA